MAKSEWGRKFSCHKCGVKYYDMKKKNVRCPECDAKYKAEKIKPRRGMRTDKLKPTPEKTIKSDPEGKLIDVGLDDDILDGENDENPKLEIFEIISKKSKYSKIWTFYSNNSNFSTFVFE